MSSPVTFSGFNNIDFNAVLTALMQQASQPLSALQDRQKALRTQVSSFDTLNGNVAALRAAARSLSSASSLSTLGAISSDNAVSATVGEDARPGQYTVVVRELARAQVTAATSVAPDANTTVVASAGTLTIGGVGVVIDQDVTLQQLADAINDTADIGVTAAVIRTGADAYRLTLTSNLTGAAHGFTVVNGLSGGTGVQFADTDQDGLSGDSDADNAVSAEDAAISINNIDVTSASNVFEDVLPGVTITVSKKDPGTTIDLTVAPNSDQLAGKLEDFVTAYNNAVKFLEAQRAAAGRGEAGSIGRDPVARQLRNALRSALTDAYGSDAYTRLAEIGIEFTSTGTLQLNQSRLDEAMEANADAVKALVGAADGAFQAVETVLDGYATSAGFISGVKERLNRQIATMDDQIASLQTRLALERASLQRQFTEADAAMSRLRSQSSSLAAFGSGLGGF